MLEVKATKQGTDREVVAMVDLGDNLQDAIEKFGEEVVFTNFQAQAKIRAQAIMRDMLTAGKTDEEINKFMASWKPGSARERITDPKIAFLRRFEKLSEEEQNKYIEELMAKIKRA
jgi:hypothetical protein